MESFGEPLFSDSHVDAGCDPGSEEEAPASEHWSCSEFQPQSSAVASSSLVSSARPLPCHQNSFSGWKWFVELEGQRPRLVCLGLRGMRPATKVLAQMVQLLEPFGFA